MEFKFGIIGYGGMGGWHHDHIPRVEGLDVIAAHDIKPDRVKAAEEKGLRGYERLGDFLADDEIDAVVIATPNDVHMELAIAAAAAGKHVVVEKPVAMNVKQLDAMVETAARRGVVFTVHQNRRWDKDYRTVRQVLAEGTLGDVHIVESRLHGPNGVIHGWRAKPEAGGGMMYDWGVHLLDQILWMDRSKVTQVECRMFSVINPEVDDYFRCHLEFESGLTAYVEVGTLCLRPLPRWYVSGETGSLRVENFQAEGGITLLREAAESHNIPLKDNPAGPTRTFSPEMKTKHLDLPLPEVKPDWLDFYRNFAATVAGREELIVKPEEVRRVLSVMEAAFESARTHQPVVPEHP